jgi:Ca2+/Na+ antiporter
MLESFADPRGQAVLLLFGGAVGLLISVLFATRAMFNEADLSPGRRALAHWLPIAVAVAVATALQRIEIAVGLIFGTSVAVLSAVVGFVTLAEPLESIPPAARRVWPFLALSSALVFAIGFQATLSLLDATILLAQGILALFIWTAAPAFNSPDAEAPPINAMRGWRVAEIVAALALAAVAAWAATRGAVKLNEAGGRYPAGVLAGTVLSVVLAMPMVSSGVPAAIRGHAWAPITAQVGVVFLNLGVLLPGVILYTHLLEWLRPIQSTTATTQPLWHPLIEALIPWRVEAVALMTLSLLLAAVSGGQLKFDRRMALYLICGYGAYLLVVLVIGALM